MKKEENNKYDHLKIEQKWQKYWEKNETFLVKEDPKKPKWYVLDMFPYPSGVGLHVGHPRGYIATDVYSRLMRMKGFNVLHPMGYDAFGLPAEQYAIEHKIHPEKAVEENIKTFKHQLEILGFSYDWERVVNTTDPKYYKWTQWIFLKLYDSWYNKNSQKADSIENLVKIFEKEGNIKINASSDNDVKEFSAKDWNDFTDLEKQKVLMKYRLAYEGFSEVNWCPELGTVLANDEVVINKEGNPVSERGDYPVLKKSLRQWFLRITAYADRLLNGLDELNWSHHIKEIQKNWIGKSEGSEIEFEITFKNGGQNGKIPVFTTRADTLFGVTYMVLSPEHPWVTLAIDENHKGVLDNREEVKKYVQEVKNKPEMERTAEEKEKTGIELKGVKAINPANKEEVPVFIADYVLAGYGTGAVMAVPAHDERDFAFAKKYNLPIKEVIIAKVVDKHDPPMADKKTVVRRMIQAIVIDPKTKKVICLRWKKFPWTTFITGGVEDGEEIIEASKREILEETGYSNVKYIKTLGGPVESHYFANHKDENRKALCSALVFELVDEEREEMSEKEKAIHDVVWLSWDEIAKEKNTKCAEYEIWLDRFFNEPHAFIENGILINSGKFDGLESREAIKAITEFVGGKIVTKYKMRDAVFARQRYWGEPIPLIHEKEGIITPLKEKDLPLTLPKVKSYQPIGTGESPLAGVKEWVKNGYETNTMPGWAGSSWYFLRYMDPKNNSEFVSKEANNYWKQVDMYVGGAEHATGHLLYSRFWNKFLYDLGLIVSEEPFKTLRNQGMILGLDGRRMSKRWGNVVNPDDVVKNVGADTLRVYECFMGPFEQQIAWSTDSMVGSRRFIEKVWKLQEKVVKDFKDNEEVAMVLNQTIKKVGEDIESMSFNTAISSMMIFTNKLEEVEKISAETYLNFIKILSPFAPHVCEEIWQEFGGKKTIADVAWPKFDESKLKSANIKIIVQVNGRVRGSIEASNDSLQEAVEKIVLSDKAIVKWLEGKEISKKIFVKNKIINFVTTSQ